MIEAKLVIRAADGFREDVICTVASTNTILTRKV